MDICVQNLVQNFPFMEGVVRKNRVFDPQSGAYDYPFFKTVKTLDREDLLSDDFFTVIKEEPREIIPRFLDILFGFYSEEPPTLKVRGVNISLLKTEIFNEGKRLYLLETPIFMYRHLYDDIRVSPTKVTSLWGYLPKRNLSGTAISN